MPSKGWPLPNMWKIRTLEAQVLKWTKRTQGQGTQTPQQRMMTEEGQLSWNWWSPHCDEVGVVTVILQTPPHREWLSTRRKRSDADPEMIGISNVQINSTTEAFATVQMPAEIGPNKLVTLKCKVDTGAGGNFMPLCAFAKLFPRHINADGSPRGLKSSLTCLTAYNGSKIPHFGTLDTAIDWTSKGKDVANHLWTWWYIADTPGPAILGLPSCAKLGIVELNYAVNLQKRKLVQQKKPTTEGRKVNQDLQHLNSPPLNTKEDLIKAYPDRFEGIGHFSGTYHITVHSDAKPIVHAPRKWLIAMWPLVWERLDEFLEQGIITPVEEPMDWVSSLTYSWKANGKLSWESAWIPKMSTKPSKETITRPPLLKRSHIY